MKTKRIHHTVQPDDRPSFNEWARHIRRMADKDHNVINPILQNNDNRETNH